MSSGYILIPHIQIHNANALSGPWIIGFPAMTAWLGGVHGMERTIRRNASFSQVRFSAAGVVCHAANLQVYRGRGYRDLISITANPLCKKGKNFERPPFIAEARIDLEVSLLIQAENLPLDQDEPLLALLESIMTSMKLAAGDVISHKKIQLLWPGSEQEEWKYLRRMMPGYACIERRSLLQSYEEKGMDGLDALLTLIGVHAKALQDEDGKVKQWKFQRAEPGWLVPLAVGFKGISPLGHVKNQRDPSYPHRFAETLVTLGEFKMVHRFSSIQDILWHYEYREDSNEYVCRNEK